MTHLLRPTTIDWQNGTTQSPTHPTSATSHGTTATLENLNTHHPSPMTTSRSTPIRARPLKRSNSLQQSFTQLQERLRCPICKQMYDLQTRRPVLMHLGHSACMICVKHAMNAQQITNTSSTSSTNSTTLTAPLTPTNFTCPLCQFIVPLTATSTASRPTDSLPFNFILTDLLEVWLLCAPPESISPVDTQQLLRCGQCIDPIVSTTQEGDHPHHLPELAPSMVASHCSACSMFLCSFHTEAHYRSRDTASHSNSIQTLAALRSKLQQAYSTEDANFQPLSLCSTFGNAAVACDLHPHLPLELFCLQCQKALCVSCSAKHTSGTSPANSISAVPIPINHTMIELSAHFLSLQSQIQDLYLPALQKSHYTVQYQCLVLEQHQTNVAMESNERMLKIEQEFIEIVQALDRRKQAILHELESHKTHTLKELSKQYQQKLTEEAILNSAKNDLLSIKHINKRHSATLCEMESKLKHEIETLIKPEDPVTTELHRLAINGLKIQEVHLLGESSGVSSLLKNIAANTPLTHSHSTADDSATSSTLPNLPSLPASAAPSTQNSARLGPLPTPPPIASETSFTLPPAANSTTIGAPATGTIAPIEPPVTLIPPQFHHPMYYNQPSGSTSISSFQSPVQARPQTPSTTTIPVSTNAGDFSLTVPSALAPLVNISVVSPAATGGTQTPNIRRSRANSLSRSTGASSRRASRERPPSVHAQREAAIDPIEDDFAVHPPPVMTDTATVVRVPRSTDELRLELQRQQEIYQRYLAAKNARLSR